MDKDVMLPRSKSLALLGDTSKQEQKPMNTIITTVPLASEHTFKLEEKTSSL